MSPVLFLKEMAKIAVLKELQRKETEGEKLIKITKKPNKNDI